MNTRIQTKPTVMIVEDDEVDIESVMRGIKARQLDCELVVFGDGQSALDGLRSFPTATREKLIVFLDINMPGMNGHQFVDEVRKDAMLARTIIFVLTTSDHERDIAAAYDKNVAGYFVKSNLDGLLDAISHYVDSVTYPPMDN